MENCLVTTLKGSVNKESLKKLGHVIFTCDNTVDDEYAPDRVSGTPVETYRFRIYSTTTALTLKLIGTYFEDANGNSLGTSTTDSQGRTIDTLIVPRADSYGTNVYIHRAPNTTTYLDIDHKYEWYYLIPVSQTEMSFAYRVDASDFLYTNPDNFLRLDVPTTTPINYVDFANFKNVSYINFWSRAPHNNSELLTCHLNDLAEAEIANGRDYTTSPKIDIKTFVGMTYYNGTKTITFTYNAGNIRIIFKQGGYELRESFSNEGRLLYDSTAE